MTKKSKGDASDCARVNPRTTLPNAACGGSREAHKIDQMYRDDSNIGETQGAVKVGAVPPGRSAWVNRIEEESPKSARRNGQTISPNAACSGRDMAQYSVSWDSIAGVTPAMSESTVQDPVVDDTSTFGTCLDRQGLTQDKADKREYMRRNARTTPPNALDVVGKWHIFSPGESPILHQGTHVTIDQEPAKVCMAIMRAKCKDMVMV